MTPDFICPSPASSTRAVRHAGRMAAARLGLDAGPAGIRLEVTGAAAAAPAPVRDDDDVADLAGDPARPAAQRAVEHQPAADAGADEHTEHVALALRRAGRLLAEHARR